MKSLRSYWQDALRHSAVSIFLQQSRIAAGLAVALVACCGYPAAAQIVRPGRTALAPTDNILTVVGNSEVK
ncbi:MAG: hypothetical protein M3Y56_15785, partial [Armatimonadota bacterium]|nr:hypothetical protein [Armatimonadota bacterium]